MFDWRTSLLPLGNGDSVCLHPLAWLDALPPQVFLSQAHTSCTLTSACQLAQGLALTPCTARWPSSSSMLTLTVSIFAKPCPCQIIPISNHAPCAQRWAKAGISHSRVGALGAAPCTQVSDLCTLCCAVVLFQQHVMCTTPKLVVHRMYAVVQEVMLRRLKRDVTASSHLCSSTIFFSA